MNAREIGVRRRMPRKALGRSSAEGGVLVCACACANAVRECGRARGCACVGKWGRKSAQEGALERARRSRLR
eukprot:2375930-Pleurochrysis_carterae.AAC.1